MTPLQSLTARDIEEAVRRHARLTLAAEWEDLDSAQVYSAVALAVRDLLIEAALETERRATASGTKRINYLSIEYLVGRSLRNNLENLGIFDLCRTTLRRLGIDLASVLEQEPDAALGNGGLGRLAACFLDSLATMGYAGQGYGINYEHGLFRQAVVAGEQVERPENWRPFGSPWLISRPTEAVAIPIYGRVVHGSTIGGQYNPVWTDWRLVVGVPADLPIVGYGGHTVSYLRLYSAHSAHDYDLRTFGRGEYLRAIEQRIADETISKVLYPSDSAEAGRELRLRQEYFFAACAVRDIVRKYLRHHDDLRALPDHVAIQLNDTHPVLAIAEMMRVLVDDHEMPWDDAWQVTHATFGYTNHTLMPEALETWPVSLLERVVPRHLLIIYEINRRFVDDVRARWPGDAERVRRASLVSSDADARIRMAHLGIVGSHSINGVSRLHTDLLRRDLFSDFAEMWPERFSNKTNGVTQRRWLLSANPDLARFLSHIVGDGWQTDLSSLSGLETRTDESDVLSRLGAIKKANKARLATYVSETLGISLDASSMFDVHAKRIHEYKRQLLNLLRVLHDYVRLTEDGRLPAAARTYLFAGKAAPGYNAAKNIIRLIVQVANLVNRDKRCNGSMRVVFLPDYRVTLAEMLLPAADLSEQISTAGMEASGTGNMKLAMNGALTIGTRDGANIELFEAVGEDNAFPFGLTASEVSERRWRAPASVAEAIAGSAGLQRIMDGFRTGRWTPADPALSQWVYDSLLVYGDHFCLLPDFEPYVAAQDRAEDLYADRPAWQRTSLLNIARVGWFSSDRTIREYAEGIWGAKPVA